MTDQTRLFDAWIDAVINNDRDILKLSFGGLILIGPLLQFMDLGTYGCFFAYIMILYFISTVSFLMSLFASLYKLQINADYLLSFGTENNDKKNNLLESKIKQYAKLMTWSFAIGMIVTVVLIFSLMIFKWQNGGV